MAGRRKYRNADPTAAAAIGNVEQERKSRAPQDKNRRGIVAEFPAIFADLNAAQAMTITLAAGRIAGTGDAWAITAEHLERAKVDYFRGDQ